MKFKKTKFSSTRTKDSFNHLMIMSLIDIENIIDIEDIITIHTYRIPLNEQTVYDRKLHATGTYKGPMILIQARFQNKDKYMEVLDKLMDSPLYINYDILGSCKFSIRFKYPEGAI